MKNNDEASYFYLFMGGCRYWTEKKIDERRGEVT